MAQLVPDPAESSLVGTTRLSYLLIKGGSASLASSIVATTSCIPNNVVSAPKPALEFLMFASLDVSRILSCLVSGVLVQFALLFQFSLFR